MFFEKGKMTVMLSQADMPEQERHAAADFIKKNVNQKYLPRIILMISGSQSL